MTPINKAWLIGQMKVADISTGKDTGGTVSGKEIMFFSVDMLIQGYLEGIQVERV